MGFVVFPAALPQPSVVSMSAAERRLLSSVAEGLPQVRLLQADFLGYENLQWEFTASNASIFQFWWVNNLLEGGRWFAASWPRVSAAVNGVCRFLLPPRWELIGHEYWRVTVGTELRGAARPPITASLLLGLHFDGDWTDTAKGHSLASVNTIGATGDPTFPTATPKFGTAHVRFGSGVYNQFYSDNRGKLIFNLDGEFQISVWVRPTMGIYSFSGGDIVDLVSWGHASGGSFVGSGGTNPPGPYTGQFRFWVKGDASFAYISFQYPTFEPSTGFSAVGILRDLVHASPVGVPVDGAWHHVGIGGDVNGIRAYIDGVQVQEDGSTVFTDPPSPGARPMWAGTIYTDQRFIVGGTPAGTYSLLGFADYPAHAAFASPYSGDMDDLEVRNGRGCVTFIGPTITVPVAPFVR